MLDVLVEAVHLGSTAGDVVGHERVCPIGPRICQPAAAGGRKVSEGWPAARAVGSPESPGTDDARAGRTIIYLSW